MTRPLRFCMITTFYPPYNFGGDGIFVRRLSHELAWRGHHVEVIHCRDTYLSLARREPEAGYDEPPNVVVHGLKSPAGSLSPLITQQTGYPAFKAARIRRILEQEFDVIHYHNISLVGGPKILAYGCGVKLYTLHEYWLGCQTHVLFKYNRAACNGPRCVLCSLVHKRPPQWWRYSGLLKKAVQHVDALIAPSQFSREWHHELNLASPVVHLPHFVPPASSPSWSGALSFDNEQTPYFLYVGRLERLKGLQTLIPVFRRYAKAQLWIAGAGTYEAKLRRLAGDSPNIRFLGHQSHDTLQKLYQQSTAVIVPSIWHEVFGQVILEAFQQGVPAIVSDMGGMPELIEESGGGFVYRSEEQLLFALDRLLDEPGLRQRLGRQAVQAYQRKWTASTHVCRYLGLIENLRAAADMRVRQGI